MMDLVAHIFVILLISSLVSSTRQTRTRFKTVARIDYYGPCDNLDYSKMSCYLNESGIEPVGPVSYGYGVGICRRDLKTFDEGVVNIRRCQDAADRKCVPFQTWRLGKNAACSYLNAKNALWTPMFTFTPPASCPLKKGIYRIRNATIDVGKLELIQFPTTGHWMVDAKAEKDKNPEYCVQFGGKFVQIKL